MRAASLLEHGFQTYGWKALFDPQSLETMPMAEDAKGPMTMRQAVISYECGTGRRRAVAKKKGAKPKVVAQDGATKAAPKQAPAAAKPKAPKAAVAKSAASSAAAKQ